MFFFVKLTQILHVTTGGPIIILLSAARQIKNAHEIVKAPSSLIILLGFLKFCVNELKHSEDQMPESFKRESEKTSKMENAHEGG